MKYLCIALMFLGFALVLGGQVYCVGWKPEWTQSQAFLSLWPLWTGGIVLVLLGYWASYKTI